MHYILTGFTQELGFRIFEFDRVQNHERVTYTVRADLALSRKYAIRMQELPLLCRRVLEDCGPAAEQTSITFTEEAMSNHAKNSAAGVKRNPARSGVAKGA